MNKDKEHFVYVSDLVRAKTTGIRHVLVCINMCSVLPNAIFIILGTGQESN